MSDVRTARETTPGPPFGCRWSCPWPKCDWWHDEPPGHDPEALERVLARHLDEAHPGWTLDDLRRHSDAYKLRGIEGDL